MGLVATVLRYEILLFLSAFALVVLYQLLTGRISTRRLLSAKDRESAGLSANQKTPGASPSRVQLLVVSIGVAIYLLAEVLRDPSHFPEVPTGLLLLMAGSEAFYLARKANKLLPGLGIRRNSPN